VLTDDIKESTVASIIIIVLARKGCAQMCVCLCESHAAAAGWCMQCRCLSCASLLSLPVDDQNAVMGTFVCVCILDVGCAALNAIRDRKIRRAARERIKIGDKKTQLLIL